MMGAIGQILLIFIMILIAFGLHGYMAFGDRLDSYSRITASITTSLGDVLGNVDYDKKAGIVPFESNSSSVGDFFGSICII